MIERKAVTGPAAAGEAGAFTSRVYLIGGPPDSDGDVIFAEPAAGHKVKVSLGEHDSALANAEPAGEAALFPAGGSVVAHGRVFDTKRGRALGTKLRAAGHEMQWSVAYGTTADLGFMSRPPTSAELKRWPDARRIIERWSVFEISPVRLGACGSMCRTLEAKCAGTCSCRPRVREPEPALVKAVKRRQTFAECVKERHGPVAWDAAQCAPRWITRGALQEGPAVAFFDYDGKRAGFWQPGSDEINVSRGLSLEQTIRTTMHEVSHWYRNWDPSEEMARLDADWLTRRYLERLAA